MSKLPVIGKVTTVDMETGEVKNVKPFLVEVVAFLYTPTFAAGADSDDSDMNIRAGFFSRPSV